MIGEKSKEESLFYYLRPEELIPKDHILRLIDKHVDFSFIRSKVKHLYSHTGRPSVDPEVMMRMLLVGYLFGITSERRLCDEVQMHLGYRWFVGLSLQDQVPDHSTFSKNRHGRFQQSGLYQEMFDEIVRRCIEKGLVSGKHLTVDSTLVKANASFRTMEPIVVSLRPQEYIAKVERENPVEGESKQNNSDEPWEPTEDFPHQGKKISNNTHRSKVDPDSRLARKSMYAKPYLSYGVSYLMDNKSRVILGANSHLPNRYADQQAALKLIRTMKWVYKLKPKTLGADKGYATGEFVHRILQQTVLPHIPIMDTRAEHDKGIYPIERFHYDAQQNRFICPQGKVLKYSKLQPHSKQHVYRASSKDCKKCPVKQQCTRSNYRSLSYHIYEASVQTARKLTQAPGYRISQIMRKRVEELFGEAKEFMGLRQAKFRRAIYVQEQVLLTAMAQNMKRIVKYLSKKGPKKGAWALNRSQTLAYKNICQFIQWAHDFWSGEGHVSFATT